MILCISGDKDCEEYSALRDDEMCEYADAFLLIEGANNKNIINNAKKMNKPCYIHTVTKEYEYVF